MKKKTMIRILTAICVVVALSCGGYLGYYYYNSMKSENNIAQIRKQIVDVPVLQPNKQEDANAYSDVVEIDHVTIQKKFEKIYGQNKDFIGWIKIEDTNIDYPVMYTPDDNENGEFYIHRDFDRNYSASGLPFIDNNCIIETPTDNVIIYGHNMNSGKMFHDLLKYEDEDFYQNHKIFDFDTIYSEGKYEIIAVFRGEILPEKSNEFKYYEFVNAGSKEEFDSYVEQLKKMSMYKTDVDVEYGDCLLTLSTCAYHVEDGRFAVVAKKIDDLEEKE